MQGTDVIGGAGAVRMPLMTLTLHAVARLPEATVLYYSVRFEQTPPDPRDFPVTVYGPGDGNLSTLQTGSPSSLLAAAAVIDVEGNVAYPALSSAPSVTLSGPVPQPTSAGQALVSYVLVKPIPASLTKAVVLLGGAFFVDVPITDGLLAPTADGAPQLGQGWPRVTTLNQAASLQPVSFGLHRHVMTKPVATPSGKTASVTTTKTPTKAKTP